MGATGQRRYEPMRNRERAGLAARKRARAGATKFSLMANCNPLQCTLPSRILTALMGEAWPNAGTSTAQGDGRPIFKRSLGPWKESNAFEAFPSIGRKLGRTILASSLRKWAKSFPR